MGEVCLIVEFDTLKCCNFNRRTKTGIGNEVLFPCSDTASDKTWEREGWLCNMPHRNMQ